MTRPLYTAIFQLEAVIPSETVLTILQTCSATV